MASVNGQEFQKMIAEVVFRGDLTKLPTNLYVGLATGLLPQKDDLFSEIVEVVGVGYARHLLNRDTTDWPSLALVNGNWKVTSLAKVWTAGGTWAAADYGFICDVATGTAGRWFCAGSLDEPFLSLLDDTWTGSAEWIGSP